MKKTVSLKENHEFRRLYHRGVSTAGKHVVIYCRRNKLGYNRLGLTVSAKLACAVKRNRIKRLFREAYRLNEDKFADGIDLVLVARVRAVGASYQEIEKYYIRLFASKIPVWQSVLFANISVMSWQVPNRLHNDESC